MEEHHIGWIAAIVIGGFAGALAEQFMKSQMGLVMYHVRRRLDRLSDCGLYRRLHPNCDRPRVQRWSSAANIKSPAHAGGATQVRSGRLKTWTPSRMQASLSRSATDHTMGE